MRRWLPIAIAISAISFAACGNEDVQFDKKTAGPVDVQPAPGGLRRILARQYVGTVRALFGEAAAAAAAPPADHTLSGFDAIGAGELSLSDVEVEQYERAAMAVANAFVADTATYEATLPCTPSQATDQACFSQFVNQIGRLVWRRPLTTAETDAIVALAMDAASENDTFEQGIIFALGNLLQSPYFVYQVEVGTPDADDPSKRRLSPAELATRMSFALLDRGPDAALLDLADAGGLDDRDDLRDIARTMLTSGEARETVNAFFSEAWRLREVASTAKDTALFPSWTSTIAVAAEQEVLRLVAAIVWEEQTDFRKVFTADYAFINDELAALYDVPAPPEGQWQKVTMPAEQGRSGLLGSAAYLSRLSHPNGTSPTRRGQFIQDRLRCLTIPPPPPDVDASPPEQPPGGDLTKKELLAATHSESLCVACHAQLDPFGLSLETFDAIGRYRAMEFGKVIDTSGEVANFGSFEDSRELGALLAEDPRVALCIVKQVYRDALGHVETEGEEATITDLEQRFGDAGYRLDQLLVELVASNAFQLVGEPK